MGAGLSAPEPIFFPRCVAVATCQGPNGSASFYRKGATNMFKVTVTGFGAPVSGALTSGAITGTLSLGQLDRKDIVSTCRVGSRGKTTSCR